MRNEALLPVGKIVGIHGLKGNLKLHFYTASLSVFKASNPIWIFDHDQWLSFEITQVKPYRRGALLSLREVTTPDSARKLIGFEVYINKTALPALEKGEYYWSDIIGLSVFTVENEYLGCVESVIPTNGNDVFVVKNKGREVLIPALTSVVSKIDVKGKKMIVELPEGLL